MGACMEYVYAVRMFQCAVLASVKLVCACACVCAFLRVSEFQRFSVSVFQCFGVSAFYHFSVVAFQRLVKIRSGVRQMFLCMLQFLC